MKYPPPPPAVIRVLACFHAALAVEWWWSGRARSTGPAFRVLTGLGSHVEGGRPMWLWAGLFTLASAAIFLALRLRVAALGAAVMLGAAGLTAFYGVLSGLAAVSDSRAAFTGLITFLFLAYWQSSVGTRLLGGNRPGWR